VEIGGLSLPATEVHNPSQTRLVFTLPRLAPMPVENRWVGVAVSNGPLRTFRTGPFTYVADPAIEAIGLYEPATNAFKPNQDRLRFNAGEYVALEGPGLSALTKISVNNHPAEDGFVVDARRIGFRVPDDTVGPLTVRVSNLAHGTAADTVSSAELAIELVAARQVAGVAQLHARRGDLMMLAQTSGGSAKVRLYTTGDGPSPVLLTTIDLDGPLHTMAMSDGYAVFSVGSRHDLVVYDISDLYAPRQVNRLFNAAGEAHEHLLLSGDTFVSLTAAAMLQGNVQAAGWQRLAFSDIGTVHDMATDGALLYLLQDSLVTVRRLTDLAPVEVSHVHALLAPRRLEMDQQHLVIWGQDAAFTPRLLVLATGGLALTAQLEALGSVAVDEPLDLAVNGELLVLAQRQDGAVRLTIYDINALNQELTLNAIVRVRGGVNNLQQLEFNADLLEWTVKTNYYDRSDYYSLKVPLLNTHGLVPARTITAEHQIIAMQIAGLPAAWEQVALDVAPWAAPEQSFVGATHLVGRELQFQTAVDAYAPDTLYRIELFIPPQPLVDGGEIAYDLPWYLQGAAYFGQTQMAVDRLSPGITVAGQPTQFVLQGARLDLAQTLMLNDVAIDAAAWTVSHEGTRLTFAAAMPEAGVHTLALSNDDQTVYLAAALVVSEPLAISTIATGLGADRVSDAGQTEVLISGTGLRDHLQVHWFEADQGFEPNEGNIIDGVSAADDTLRFVSPPAAAGRQHQVVIRKPGTGEEIWVDSLLTAVDDTPPVLTSDQGLDCHRPLTLRFSEPVTGVDFAVSLRYLEYQARPEEDVTHRFELMGDGSRIITIRPRYNESLQHNREYGLRVFGVHDLQGNPAGASWEFSDIFRTSDTLSPRNLDLVRQSDLASASGPMQLTRGRSVTFVPQAIDNTSSPGQLTYQRRISSDAGLSFGPPQNTTLAGFTVQTAQADQDLVIRLQVLDPAGNPAQKEFTIAMVDPQITPSALYTAPPVVQESTKADICFDVTGDIDLLTSATMEILGRSYAAQITQKDALTQKLVLAYTNPGLDQVAGGQVPVVARMAVNGRQDLVTAAGSYALAADTQAPTLAIVSPPDGSAVPVGENTTIVIQAYDAHGVHYVTVSENGAAARQLLHPDRYEFNPANTNPVTLTFEALDMNGNRTTAAITLQPYDKAAEKPTLNLLAPSNGAEFHGGQMITVAVAMHQVDQATLFMDIGGDQSHPGNPVPLALIRGPEDPARFDRTVQLPAVSEDVVVILRLEAQGLQARRFINVVADGGIDQELIIALKPAATILGGTDLWIAADVPPGMEDYSNQSTIIVADPGRATRYLAPGSSAHRVGIGPDGHAVQIEGILRDRSGHTRSSQRLISKTAYFSDTVNTVYQAPHGAAAIGDMVVVPGLTPAGAELIWVVNQHQGVDAPSDRYELRNAAGQVIDQGSGWVEQLQFTGSGLVARQAPAAHDNRNASGHLMYWPLVDGALGAAVTRPLYGESLGGSGNVLFTRHGDLLDGCVFNNGEFIALAGRPVSDEIRMTAVDADRLFVLTANGVYAFRAEMDAVPALEPLFYTALPPAEGLHVAADLLVIWSGGTLQRYRMLPGGDLLALDAIASDGDIIRAVDDGELLWLLVDGSPSGMIWQGYRDDELVALYRNQADRIVFAGNTVYERIAADGTAGVIRARRLAPAIQDTAFEPALVETPLGVVIRDTAASATLGAESYAFFDQGGLIRLAAQPIWRDMQRQWFLPRRQLPDGGIRVIRSDRGGHSDTVTLLPAAAEFADIQQTTPAADADLVKGARVPLILHLDPSARFEDLKIQFDGREKPVITGSAATAYQWLDVPEPAGEAWLTVDTVAPGGTSGPFNFNLKANQPGLDIVKILQPQSNQSFTEGGRLTVEFSASQDSGRAFRYAEISLYDTQPDSPPLDRRLVKATQGRVALQLPLLTDWQNFSVRVRSYYGADYNYSESAVNIKVFPSLEQPGLEISTDSLRVMQGSQFSARIPTPVPAGGGAWIDVRDDQDHLLAAGATQAALTVPAGVSALRVTARVSDGRGNTNEQTRLIEVIEALGLAAVPETEFRRFDAGLAAVGDAWFARDRELYDITGQPLAILDAPITALDHLGHRLVLALANTGLAVIERPGGTGGGLRELSRRPISGTISQLAAADGGLLAVVDGEIYGFRVSGNAIEDPTPIPVSGRVLDIQARSDRFIVLSDAQLRLIDGDFGTVRQLSGSFEALAQTRDFIFATDRDGRLHSLRDDWRRQSFDLGIRAERLLVLQGDLLALTSDREAGSGAIQVIDIRHPLQPEVIGRFARDFDDALSQALLAGGRIWLGGSRGMVLALQPASHDPVGLYRSQQARGSIPDVAIARNRYLAAANDLGTIILARDPSGTWNETVYPAPYTHGTRAVSAANETAYLMQRDSKRVTALNSTGSEKIIFSGHPFEHLASTRSEIVAAAADQLLIAPSVGTGSHSIALGQLIETLATAGDSLLVSTQDQYVRQLNLKQLPVSVWQDDSRVIDGIAGSEPVRRMASDGDHLYYAHADRLYRLPLLPAADEIPLEDQTTLGHTIEALAIGSGSLWLGAANHIYRLPTDTPLAQLPPEVLNTPFLTVACRFAATCEVTSLALEGDHLLVGLGADGLALYRLSPLAAGASPSLYAPTAGTIYAPDQEIALQLNESAGVNAVRYRINGQIAAQRTHAPFDARIRVPAGILNGQTFEIVSEIETVWGSVRTAEPRRVKLLGDPLSGLDFGIDLAVDGRYLTQPVRLQATVTDAAYPMAQVEFYYSSSTTGPWELIDTLYGPEYVISRDFDSQTHGHYLKARAVDVYGFYKDSAVKQINRQPDTTAPQAPVFSLAGDLKDGRPLAGRPFSVTVSCIDLASGIAQALLYLDGNMVDIRFDDGNLSHAVLLPATGASYDFSVILRDHAGHEISGAATYTVYEDAPPSKPIVVADNPIRERSQFTVTVAASDDMGVKSARVAWHGQTAAKVFSGSNTSEQTVFTIRDDRGERLSETVAEPLTVTITDSADQTSSETVTVAVQPDAPPDAALLGIQVPVRAYYGSNLPVDFFNLAASDDGGVEDLTLVIENRITGQTLELAGQPTIQTTLKTPSTVVSNDEFPLTVSLVDGLGQASLGIDLRVPLYHIPNLIRFEAAGNSSLNPDAAAVGETVTLQVQVLDSAWQPVAGQGVEWRIETGPDLSDVLLDTTTSDVNGLARLVFSTQRQAGSYRIRAVLPEFTAIETVHQLDVLPGPPDHIEIAYVPPVAAAEIVSFRLLAVDAAHNPVPALDNESVILQIADPGFHFEFAENVSVGDLPAGETVVGEQATIELIEGRAEVQASAPEIAGSYSAQIAFEAGSSLFARYDADGDPLTEPAAAGQVPLTVVPGPPAALRLEQIAMSNHDLGDPDILEVTETATLQLRLEDDYGNLVLTVADGDGGRRDADFKVELAISGSAYSGYQHGQDGSLIVYADQADYSSLAEKELIVFEIAPGTFLIDHDFENYAWLFGQNTPPDDLMTPLSRFFVNPTAVESIAKTLTVTYASGKDAHYGGGVQRQNQLGCPHRHRSFSVHKQLLVV